MVKYFTPNQLPLGWSQKVALMTQDFNFEVRNEIAKQLKSIFKHLSDEDILASKMHERAIEIINDEEEEVQITSIHILPWILDRLHPEQLEQHIKTPLLTLIRDSTKSTNLFATIFYQLGKICQSLENKGILNSFIEQIINLLLEGQIDKGDKIKTAYVSEHFKGLSQQQDFQADTEIVAQSVWQVNQRSICYNLPALAMFLDERVFFSILFPHLQSLQGNKEINLKLSLVLPQTLLCLRGDDSRTQILELIWQIGSLAIQDQDTVLIKTLMRDMAMVYKQYLVDNCSSDPNIFLDHQYYNSKVFFDEKIEPLVFQFFQESINDWRSFQMCLNFFDQCIRLIPRKEIKTKYVPLIIKHFTDFNNSVKL